MADPYATRRERLVHDRLPEPPGGPGGRASLRVADPAELPGLLLAKLYEEADEFAVHPSPAGLADLLEVVLALADGLGCGPRELERIRAERAEERGGFAGRLVLRETEPPARRTVRKARALLLDGAELLLFRRTRPGLAPYWTTPGGKVEPEDRDVQSALRRELREELGASAGPLRGVFTYTEHRPQADYVHRFFLCRLESMDLSQRCGPEFTDPTRGRYDVERLPCKSESFERLALWPSQLRDFLVEQADELPSQI